MAVPATRSPSPNDTKCTTICGRTPASVRLYAPSKVRKTGRKEVLHMLTSTRRVRQAVLAARLADDAHQDALERAAVHLPGQGVPEGVLPLAVAQEAREDAREQRGDASLCQHTALHVRGPGARRLLTHTHRLTTPL